MVPLTAVILWRTEAQIRQKKDKKKVTERVLSSGC